MVNNKQNIKNCLNDLKQLTIQENLDSIKIIIMEHEDVLVHGGEYSLGIIRDKLSEINASLLQVIELVEQRYSKE